MSPAAKDQTGTGCRILVVDDDEDVLLLLEHEIRDLGHTVVGASDAKTAISEMEHRHFDIVITDVRMPGMDGIQLTEWIRDNSPDSDVIIMTGYASVDTAAEALRLGAFDSLMKPFGQIELVTSSINRAVEKQMLQAGLKRSMEAEQKSREEAQEWARENALVAQVGRNLSSTLDGDEIQSAVLRWINQGLEGEIAAILLPVVPMSQRPWRLLVNVYGIDEIAGGEQIKEQLIKGIQAFSHRLAQTGEIQIIVNEKAAAEQSITGLDGRKLESFLCAPLIVRDEVIGMIGVGSVTPGRFGARNLGFLSAIANQAAVAINNSRLHKQELLEKQQLESILNNMSDGLLVLDEDWRVVTMNPTLERMLGLESKGVLGRRPSEASSDSRLASLATLCGGRGPDSPLDRSGVEDSVVEWDVTLDISGRRDFRASTAVETDDEGRYLGEVMVVHDVTREKELEQMKSDFLANTSHELRTPLHSIKGFIKLLVQGEVPELDTQREFFTIIKEQSDILSILVDELLDVSRIDADHLELKLDHLSMGNVIDKTVRNLANLAHDKGIEIEVSVSPSLSTVQGDEGRLTQALTNLLGNAIKFSHEKGRIIVRAKTEDSKVLVQVVDHGLGIPPDSIPRLFQRFYQVDASTTRQNPGTGLGLYITKQIIESHGGRIWVESKVGVGSTFSFTLPLDACVDMPMVT